MYVLVCVCVGVCGEDRMGGVWNKEASKHSESVSSKAHKYSSLVLISPTHTHTHTDIRTDVYTHTYTFTRAHTHTHVQGSTARVTPDRSPADSHAESQPNNP